MVGAILGGLSAVASGLSAIQNFQQARQAEKAAENFGNQLQGIKEVDKYAALQTPDVSSLLKQQTSQQTASATQAIQGMGSEGAAQIANVYQAGREADAQAAQQQAQMNLDVAATKAGAAQDIEYRNKAAQRELAGLRLEGAQQKATDKYNAGIAGIEGLIGGLGMAAGDIVGLSKFDYSKDKSK